MRLYAAIRLGSNGEYVDTSTVSLSAGGAAVRASGSKDVSEQFPVVRIAEIQPRGK
jgi:hypothetical protein